MPHGMTSNPAAEPAAARRSIFQKADLEARRLVGDLHVPNPRIFWTDMLLSAGIGWGAFAVALAARPFSPAMLAAAAVAVLALYRGMCFLHEITHLKQSALGGFETTWNLLLGVPMLMPSFIYVGVHQNHHKLSTYGTTQDPEYLPFSGKRLMISLFAVEALAIPVLLVVRFVVLAPFSLLFPKLRRWLAVHASALCLNSQYRREFSDSLSRKMARWEAATLGAWSVLIGLAIFHIVPWRMFALWAAVTALASFINTLRTLGAHRYSSDGRPLDREAQLGDSIDTPGAFWTELWAPVGLRYHALHHYFPGIPYHNLRAAYRRLIQIPPLDWYSQSTSPGLPHSLGTLYRGEPAAKPQS
jgi:fatty acid desaturase